MGTTTTVENAQNVRVNEGLFLRIARDYATNRKVCDALSSAEGSPDDAFARAMKVRDDLAILVAHGTDYTPPTGLGFGSSNSATIAAGILGQGLTGSQIRKKFADLGKIKKS
jgi:hypothetical protein